ncbi:MAG: aldo/keto reductase [Anaerococcus vaginalis]|uniref:aldo/keto reductase n=1 Tax=Anaerococcus vaginalis TaxID=33037 RepID=UPI001DBC1F2C|nr:aldo/keto reductase [Anaerococcus vaginalis]MBS4890170.1 aldo/keto reductase [Anaerococcus vaginalis]MDU6182849.1 aldo/keto reductase [Anaerococcus vaginalis]MDU7433604.1 aldo/keto reductase [Anaerococcus vaginalis]
MKYIKLGKTDIEISKLGLGTWAIGAGSAWDAEVDVEKSEATIVEAVNSGVNLIDTAPGYNFGESEKIVGKALGKVNREKVCLITKCGIVWERKGALFNKVGDRQLYKLLTPESIRLEIESSLKRLKTDYIDVYMTHWQAVEPYYTPISEVVEELTKLKKEGKIKAIGAANVNADQVREYLDAGELDIVQAKYNILDRSVEKDILPLCIENKVTLQAYSPLEQGLLTGLFGKDYKATGARANKYWWQKENIGYVVDMLEKWKPLTEKYNCTIPTLALAWIINQNDNINLLMGATTPEEVKENVLAGELDISKEDINYISKLADDIYGLAKNK